MASSEQLDLSGMDFDDLEYVSQAVSGVESLTPGSAMSIADGPTSGRSCCTGGPFTHAPGGSFSLGH